MVRQKIHLERRGLALDACVQIDVARELLMERATLRRTDKVTGQIYHLKYNPPPPGPDLVHRADDREETVRRRLAVYRSQTEPLIEWYRSRGVLETVAGDRGVEEISKQIQQVFA